MKESDLYLPLKAFFTAQGYEVKGEIKNCDVMAIRGDEAPVIIELKLSMNLSVVLQAVDRLALSSRVYICLPKTYKMQRRRKHIIMKLLKMLGLGLIVIDTSIKIGAVDVVLDPQPYRPRQSKALLNKHLAEFHNRDGDPNLGGSSTATGRVTAYRQRALVIGNYLKDHGATKAAVIAEHTQDPKARDILYKNHYGWFDKPTRGVYQLTDHGFDEIGKWS